MRKTKKRTTKKRTTKRATGVWQRLVRQEMKQGDSLSKALKDAKKRYAVYKRTGKIPPKI